jgi:DNA repair ATPase RecN
MSDIIIVALITGAFGFFGNWVINNKTLAVIQERLSQLEKKQDKHNQLIERMYNLEKDVDVAFERIRENSEDIDKLEKHS